MKSSRAFFIFGAIGILLIVAAGGVASSSLSLLQRGVVVSGLVTDVKESRYTDKKGNSKRRFSSTVSFTPASGAPKTFSQDGDYGRGSRVDVVYDPSDIGSARIKSFSSLWGGATALGVAGLIFSLVGFGGGSFAIKRERAIAHLLVHGQSIRARIVGVKSHRSSGKGRRRRSYQVVARAVEPIPGIPDELLSETLREEPSDAIIGTDVEVLIDPQNPRSYVFYAA